MDWTVVEDALVAWVQTAGGLAAGQVIWERGGGPRPTGTWVGLRRGLLPRGRPWADHAVNPMVLSDDVVESVSAAADTLTLTAHAYQTGDGPVRFTTTDTLPDPLATGTDYWLVRVDADTIKVATTFANAMAGTPTVVDLTDAGTGTHTIVDTADTLRAGEEITHTARAPSILTVTMQCYGGDASDDGSPEAVLAAVKTGSVLPSVSAALDAAGIGLATFSEIQALELQFDGATDVRALMTLTAHVADTQTELGTIIETVETSQDPPIT
jgi:hypothetical protein